MLWRKNFLHELLGKCYCIGGIVRTAISDRRRSQDNTGVISRLVSFCTDISVLCITDHTPCLPSSCPVYVWLFTHLYCNPLSRLAKFWRITAILPQLLIRHIYLLHSTGRNIHPLVLAIFSNSCVWFIWVFLKRFCLLTHVWLCALHKYINFTKHFFCYILCTAINWEEPPTILHSPARRRHLPVLSSLRPSHLSPNEHLF